MAGWKRLCEDGQSVWTQQELVMLVYHTQQYCSLVNVTAARVERSHIFFLGRRFGFPRGSCTETIFSSCILSDEVTVRNSGPDRHDSICSNLAGVNKSL